MSTYDAYNLSLRDSTEFTVPAGGGDSGDSDFSIAQLTIDGTKVEDYLEPIYIPIIQNGNTCSFCEIIPGEQIAYDVILYKGKAYLSPGTGVDSISGAIVPHENEANRYVITGNCCIVLSGGGK